MHIEIKDIVFGSMEYEQEIALRTKILRAPLGLTYRQEDLRKELHDIHLGAFGDGKLLGCALLAPVDAKTLKMRQVAVDSAAQGLGIGRQLVVACELRAHDLGYLQIELSARETALDFYSKLGYETCGESFIEVTIPHRKMRKRL